MHINYISLLKSILDKGGFSQEKLAAKLGVTFAALNRWLNGRAVPRTGKLEAIRKLHKEIVGYPAISEEHLREIVDTAEALKIRNLWAKIADHRALQDKLLIEHTFNSTSIEGTTFTKKETEIVIFEKGVVTDKTLTEHLEVTNHAAVLRGMLLKRNRELVTERGIKELHRNLMQGLREDAGLYSKYHRAIRGVEIALTHPKDIPEEMRSLVRNWHRTRRKTVKEIALFHIGFELIHPFGDGNGRVGRLLMILQCLMCNFPPVIVETARKAEYYEVLEYAQRKSENPFIAFLADEMQRTHRIISKYL